MQRQQSSIVLKDEWLTPPAIIRALGEFDLDPCSPVNRPWPTAKHHYTIEDDGLFQNWFGRVWMNPPYGRIMGAWLNRLALHGNGIALTFARTDTNDFHNYVFSHALSMLFIKQRIRFYNVDGTPGYTQKGLPATADVPSVLIAYGEHNVEALEQCSIPGKHVYLNSVPVIVVGVSPTWKSIVSITLGRLNGEGELEAIYSMVETIAPDKVEANRHYKAKVRQTLQGYFTRIKKGYYSSRSE